MPNIRNEDGPFEQQIQALGELGVCGYFQGTKPWKTLRDHSECFQHPLGIPPIISADYECRVAIEGGTSLGAAMNLGAVADPSERERLAYETGKSCAMQGRMVGTRWTFAPVADINAHPDNPITNVRGFSDDPHRIIPLIRAFIGGAQDHGMAATAKHFPGDGFDWRDQHVVTSVNPQDEKAWRDSSGRVFRAAIDAGVHSIMMGHIALPWLNDLDPRTGEHLPATLSRKAHRLLREELGFDGVIVSDALGMGGMMWHCQTPMDAVIGNLRAGSDVVLFPENVHEAVEATLAAIERGELDEQEINRSVKRVMALKEKTGLLHFIGKSILPAEETAKALFSSLTHSAAVDLGRKSLTLVRDREQNYPLPPKSRVLLIPLPVEEPTLDSLMVVGQEKINQRWQPLQQALQQAGCRVTILHDPKTWTQHLEQNDAAIYLFRQSPQAGRSSIRLAYPALQWIEQTRWPKDRRISRYYVSFGSPYILDELPHLPNFVCGYSDVPTVQTAYADALLGNIPFLGELPVTIASEAA